MPVRPELSAFSRRYWVVAIAVVLTVLVLMLRHTFIAPPIDAFGIAFNSMSWHARLRVLPPGMTQSDLQRRLQQRLDELDAILSTWRADSELSHLNRAPVGSAVAVSATLFDAIDKANRVSALTSGAYDITVSPLVNLWGFGPHKVSNRVPSDAEISLARQRVGWQQLVLNQAQKTVTRLADVEMDLSSVGEGVACDELAALLAQLGVENYSLSVAGAVLTNGTRADGMPWQIAVEKPDATGAIQHRLNVRDVAMASAGSYRNYRELDGMRFSHIIDARNGLPITHNGVQVTVITQGASMDATYADALDTALEVLGPAEGFALAEKLHIAALFIEKTEHGFVESPTSAFVALGSAQL